MLKILLVILFLTFTTMNNTVYPAKLDTLYRAIDNRQSQNGQPLIGISANFENGNSCIEHSYVISLLQAGAIPVLLPVHNDIETLRNTVEQLDGLMLTGGGDINPLYGNEEPLPPLGSMDAARDQFDFTLVKLAADRQIPIFGICRGHQIINMAFGGSNYQDIYFQNDRQLLKHNQSISREYGSHTVNLENNTILHAVLGTDSLIVNSYHHQAIKEVAPGFRVSATSPDGIVEAMEGMPGQRIFSVQWHPEKMAVRPDEQMMKLFHYFAEEAALFKKAKEIHRNSLIIDSHCDTPMKFTENFNFGQRHEEVKVDLPKMQEGREDAIFMVAYLHQEARDEASSLAATQKAVDILYRIVEQVKLNENQVGIAYNVNDLIYLKNAGKKAIFLAIENGYAIGKDLGNLSMFKEMGITYITLCHNGSNDICDSAKGEAEHNGLSPFGREVVKEINRLGIIIDISHAGDKTVQDVLELSNAPIIASHSSARALCDHPRNLTDDQIKAIAAKGGVVQVCLYNSFLSKQPAPTILDAVAHINHIVQLVGIDHVGIGTDFDGDDTEKLIGCRAANEVINLTVELLRQGYTEEELHKLWGDNLLRVLNTVQNN